MGEFIRLECSASDAYRSTRLEDMQRFPSHFESVTANVATRESHLIGAPALWEWLSIVKSPFCEEEILWPIVDVCSALPF